MDVLGRFKLQRRTNRASRRLAATPKSARQQRRSVRIWQAPTRRERKIMLGNRATEPDSTAVRVALWRAMHVQVDPPAHVFEDEVGLKLAAPDEGWRRRPGHQPVHAALPRLHPGPRSLYRRSRRGAGGK